MRAAITPAVPVLSVVGHGAGEDGRVLPRAGLLPVLPALRELLPDGALRRGSVIAAGEWGLLCLALAAGAAAAGAWCAVAGIPEAGMVAAAGAGIDPDRLLLVPGLGGNWPHAVASLLDGVDLVLLRPPSAPSAQARRVLEAALRRHRAVLLVAGDWAGARVRLRVVTREWTGIGSGHGLLRACRIRVVADGRGEWSRPRARWLWLPGSDGEVASGEVASGGEIASRAIAAG